MTDKTPEAPKRGRKPTRQESAHGRVTARVPPSDKAAWDEHAAAQGKSFSAWMIDTLNAAVAKSDKA